MRPTRKRLLTDGGETVHMSLIQGQKLFAIAEQDNDLMVTRQD